MHNFKRNHFLWLLAGLLLLPATGFAQNKPLSIQADNMTIREILTVIESQTEFTFSYNNTQVDVNKKVTGSFQNMPVTDLLERVLKGNGIIYEIVGKQIILKPEPVKNGTPVIQQGFRVTGTVSDDRRGAMTGVTVNVRGSVTAATVTDVNGEFTLTVPGDTSVLQFRFIGYKMQEVTVGKRRIIAVSMQEESTEVGEVVVVAFGKQKKESVVSSIQMVSVQDLRIPSSNLTTAFAGKMAGVISYQTSGEPGMDNAEFFIRGITTFGAGKVDPLILVDNVEVSTHDLSRLHPDDIQSFSILKDATATALYGARGANGVVLVTTKEGREGKARVSFRFENSFSSPTTTIKMADPITYMEMANEAALTRNPLAPIPYYYSKIDNTIRGTNPYVYPTVDWMDMLTKKTTVNQRANLNISGGGGIARYYIAASLSQDNGILKVDRRNNFNNNIDLKKYLVRSNVNIDLSRSTEAIIRVHGTFDDYTGPIMSGSDMYRSILNVSPVRFPAYYEPDEHYQRFDRILFGGEMANNSTFYMNPYAELVKGYREESKTVMLAQFELKQDFGEWVKGLNARLLGSTTRNAAFDLSRSYKPFYYQVPLGQYNRYTDTYTLIPLNELGANVGTEYLDYRPGYKSVSSSFYAEGSVNYNQTFGKHGVSGMLVGIIRHSISGNEGTLFESLPKRNLGLSGRFTYDFDSRYLAELNFGYNGSEKFDKRHRWGFFPSAGLGWIPSNEAFWGENLKKVVSKLKIRGTYGMVGNDEISSQRFFYLSEVLPGEGENIGSGYRYGTGYNFNGIDRRGMEIKTYANPNIGWEIAYKSNIGLEVGLMQGKIEILADLFRERRVNILQNRADISTEMGLWSTPQSNVGKADGKGVDISVDYKQNFTSELWMIGRANFTYARSTYRYYEEPDYAILQAPWRSRYGHAISQQWGYVAERMFIDQADIDNSPRQDFGIYLPGDIKYKDINQDGVINELDLVPIGYPTTPEINYGFGISAGYKNFDISLFLQGSARSSFWIDAKAMSPFILKNKFDPDDENESVKPWMETGLAKFVANNYWSEATQNPDAFWPRLSNYVIDNNVQRSTQYMQNGAFLRLKSAEIGYSLPEKVTGKLKLTSCRFYVSGTNLLLFSKFKLWDVEMGGNGLGYPLQRVINLGINLTF